MQWRYIGIFDAFFDAKQRGLWMRLQSPLHYTLFSFLVWFNCTYGNTFTPSQSELFSKVQIRLGGVAFWALSAFPRSHSQRLGPRQACTRSALL